jgi:two-component system chemotaxis response regulator CheB
VIAQDHESSVVWGMPGSVVEAGLADDVVSIDDVAPAIMAKFNNEPVYATV